MQKSICNISVTYRNLAEKHICHITVADICRMTVTDMFFGQIPVCHRYVTDSFPTDKILPVVYT